MMFGSKLLTAGALVSAIMAITVGLMMFTTIPKQMGLYRMLTRMNPVFVGIIPAFHYGIEWGYTWEEFYSNGPGILSGQTAIVTGANAGIGYDLSLALAKVGASVTMVCRTKSKCDQAKAEIETKLLSSSTKGGSVRTMIMDTSSLASVRSFCEQYVEYYANNKEENTIDMLFLNAGTSFLLLKESDQVKDNPNCVPKTEEDGIEYLFQVNYLGHHLMYRLLEPLLSPNARIIQTTSASSFSTYTYKVATDLETLHGCSEPYIEYRTGENLAYGQSKLAQILWCKALTRHLQHDNNKNIAANAFHPGLVNTQIQEKIFERSQVSSYFRDFFEKIVLPNAWFSPDGALSGLYLATRKNNDIKGQYFHPQAQEVINPMSLDEKLQDDLWAFSDELVKDFLAPIA